ncbi:MAG: hypothetical protein HDT28_00765, partial [Clostridiales bacterium]|nr:hypothetical protein [Clostridiales bacterium]
MKSFKKGIALIAVLAFLITAILPISGLAAEEHSATQTDNTGRVAESRAVTLSPTPTNTNLTPGGVVANKVYYQGSTAMSPDTGILHAEWQAASGDVLDETYWAWSNETGAWTAGPSQPTADVAVAWLANATPLTSTQENTCVKTVSSPEQLPGSQKWDLTLQPAITDAWTLDDPTNGTKYQVAFIAKYHNGSDTKYDFLGFNVTMKAVPAPDPSSDWNSTMNTAQYPYVTGAELPKLPAYFVPQDSWPADAAAAAALNTQYGAPTISWMYSESQITKSTWNALAGAGSLKTAGWDTTLTPTKSPDGTKDAPSTSTLTIPDADAAAIKTLLDAGKPVYIGAQALWGNGAINWDNSMNFASYVLRPVTAETPLASTVANGKLTATISGLDATIKASTAGLTGLGADQYILTNLKLTQVNNASPSASVVTQTNPSGGDATAGAGGTTEAVTNTILQFKKPGTYKLVADMTFTKPDIKGNANWQRTLVGAQFEVKITDGGLELAASDASGQFTGNPGVWTAANATAANPMEVAVTNTDPITLTGPTISGTPVTGSSPTY